MLPIFIRALQGQSKTLDFEDSDIAKHWYSWKSQAQLGSHAAFAGRPLIPIENVPPRLYHRTVKDAAFAILNGALEPGYGSSGNAFAYFAKLPLEEMGPSTSGVRADCPTEIVFETNEVMKHTWLMESTSEGVLTRESVPLASSTSGTPCLARRYTPVPQSLNSSSRRTLWRRRQAALTGRPLFPLLPLPPC